MCVFRVFRPVQTQREIRKTNERDTKQKNDSKREREFREREKKSAKVLFDA